MLLLMGCLCALTNGLDPVVYAAPLRDVSMVVITFLVIRWWLALTVGRSDRHFLLKPPRPVSLIDAMVAVWMVAIVIAWFANNLSNRRSTIGAWYDGMGLLAMIVLVDLIRRGVPRRWLVDGLLLTGVFWLIVGVEQSLLWLSFWRQTSGSGLPFLPLRPSGVFGDPNSFATGLLPLLFMSVARFFDAKRLIGRLVWLIYAGFSLLLLFVSQSRGGWIGAAGGILVGIILLFRFSRWRLPWRQIAGIIGVMVVAGVVATIFVILPAFRATERGDNRPEIYKIAIQSFVQQPLVGHGPDSFGQLLLENQSIPPEPAHAHAHETVLNIAAELGIPGLVALAVSLLLGTWMYWRNLSRAVIADRPLLIGLGVSCAAIAIHQLFDVTAVQPAVLLLDVGLFTAAIAPGPWLTKTGDNASPVNALTTDKNTGQQWLLRLAAMVLTGGLTLFILIAGWIGTLAYDPYWAGIKAVSEQPFPAGWVTAQPLLETAVSRDPQSPVTNFEAGYVDGLLSLIKSDSALRDKAIGYYEQSLALEPPNSINWLNLAILYAKAGRADEASHAAEQLIRYASKYPLFLINGGLILEQFGHSAEASSAYTAALKLAPELIGQPIWQVTALRQTIESGTLPVPSYTKQFLTFLNAGNIDAAMKTLADARAVYWVYAQPFIDSALLLIRTHGDLAQAERDLNAASMSLDVFHDWPWFHYVQSELDAARGDQTGHDREVALIAHDPSHDVDGVSIYGNNAVSHAYYMEDLPRTLLPGTWFPAIPSDLLPLLPTSLTAGIPNAAVPTSP